MEEGEAGVPRQLVVDVAADPEREVDPLRLEPGELATERVDRRRIVVAGHAEQLVVALVAAEDGVREVEPDHRGLGERRVPLVLEPARRHQVAGVGGLGALGRQDRALAGTSSMSGWPASDSLWMFARRYQEERCQNRFAAASASAWVASRRSFVACHGGAAGSTG